MAKQWKSALRRLAYSASEWALSKMRASIWKPPVKFIIIAYLVLRTKEPFDKWGTRRINKHEFAAWAVALTGISAGLVPILSDKAAWIDGYDPLSYEQRI
jgi:hypothetical protein